MSHRAVTVPAKPAAIARRQATGKHLGIKERGYILYIYIYTVMRTVWLFSGLCILGAPWFLMCFVVFLDVQMLLYDFTHRPE